MSNLVSLPNVTQALETLTDDERAALRASRFHFGPAPPPSTRRSRLAHPGGALATNKVVALEKFLKRKLGEGSVSLDPDLVRNAVDNAKATSRSGLSLASESIRHVDSFSGSDKEQSEEDLENESENRKNKRKRARKFVKEGHGVSSKTHREAQKKKPKKKKMDRKFAKRDIAKDSGNDKQKSTKKTIRKGGKSKRSQ